MGGWTLAEYRMAVRQHFGGSRNCIIPSQPARFTAGPMNLEQMSRSLRSFLFIKSAVKLLTHIQAQGQCPTGHHLAGSTLTYKLLNVVTLLSGEQQG